MVKARPWYSRALLATAEYAGRTVKFGPGLVAAVAFVVAGWMIAAPLGVAMVGVFALWADWRLR